MLAKWHGLSSATPGRTGKEKVKQILIDELSAAFFRIRPEFGPNPGYMDLEGNRLGSDWPEVLGGELRTAPILVPLYSPSYFASEECGRETQAFLLRLEDHGRRHPQGPSPRCILPAAWIRKRLTVPALLGDIHYEMPKPPAEYASYGLERLLSVQDLFPRFQEFVRDFASEISDALDQLPHVSPARVTRLPRYGFSMDRRARGGRPARYSRHCGCPVRIYCRYRRGTPGRAAGRRGVPGRIAATGKSFSRRSTIPSDASPMSSWWRKSFRCEPLPFDDRLLERIAAAEAQHKIVALVVDSWVTRLPNYTPPPRNSTGTTPATALSSSH